jgi:Tol biopolymer transport system component
MVGIGGVVVLTAALSLSGSEKRVGPLRLEQEASAAWSPDGRRIAITREYLDADTSLRHWEIWDVRVDGARQQPIARVATDETRPFWSSRLLWSPDGRRIAYQFETQFRRFGIGVVMADGTDDRPVTFTPTGVLTAWSGDGRRIFFIRSGALYSVDVRTRRVTRITRSGGWRSGADPIPDTAQLSGDARWLAFSTEIEEEGDQPEYEELEIVTAAGTHWGTVGLDYLDDELAFAWAPRGARLAFAAEHRLFVTTPPEEPFFLTGEEPRRVAGARSVISVAWSPNGERLLWNSGQSAFYVADADGRRRRAIVTLETLAEVRGDGTVRPLRGVRVLPAISADEVSWGPGGLVALRLSIPCEDGDIHPRGLHVVNTSTGVLRRLTSRC